MRLAILLTTLLLTGCFKTTVPVKITLPEPPPQLLEPCKELLTIDKAEVKLSELMNTVVKNYTQYHHCSDIVKIWQAWYKAQQEIYNTIGDK